MKNRDDGRIGHNTGVNRETADQLRSYIERIERLTEEKQTVAEDIKEVYGEAKSNGFDTKTMRKIVAIRKKDKAEREEEEHMLDTYLHALGMINNERDDDDEVV